MLIERKIALLTRNGHDRINLHLVQAKLFAMHIWHVLLTDYRSNLLQ